LPPRFYWPASSVVCSPSAACSKWVNEEIRTFKELGRESKIFALIASGEPESFGGANGELEGFPAALRFGIRADGQIPPNVRVRAW